MHWKNVGFGEWWNPPEGKYQNSFGLVIMLYFTRWECFSEPPCFCISVGGFAKIAWNGDCKLNVEKNEELQLMINRFVHHEQTWNNKNIISLRTIICHCHRPHRISSSYVIIIIIVIVIIICHHHYHRHHHGRHHRRHHRHCHCHHDKLCPLLLFQKWVIVVNPHKSSLTSCLYPVKQS